MMIDVIGVRRLGDFKLELEFSDGTVGVRDFGSILEKSGPMVEPLKDPAYFARVFIEDGALTWPNGYDWDPIASHDEMKAAGLLRQSHAAGNFLTHLPSAPPSSPPVECPTFRTGACASCLASAFPVASASPTRPR